MSFNRYNSQSYTPSAPSLPESYGQNQAHNYNNNNNPSSSSYSYGQQHQYQHHQQQQPQYGGGNYYEQQQQQQPPYGGGNYYGQQQVSSSSLSSQGQPWFPPGTHPDVIRSFQMVDRDRSGFIDEFELQQALSSGYQTFNLRTIRLLLFLFKNPNDPLRIGPSEFNALWSCLGQWRGIFERFDKDRSGKIDAAELRDALHSIGYAIPPSVLQVLISKYDDGSGRRVELNFDSFVECGMIVKGLTEKFKEKDPRYTGSATLPYETYMSMIIPFLV